MELFRMKQEPTSCGFNGPDALQSWPLCLTRTIPLPHDGKGPETPSTRSCSGSEGEELLDEEATPKVQEELQKHNANFKMLYDMQQQLIATLQEQLRVQEIDLDSMKQVNAWQEKELASLKSQLQRPFDGEKRHLPEPDEAEAKSLEKLKSELAKKSAEWTLYREQADAHAMEAMATSVQAGWKAACALPHESTVSLRTSVVPADKTEFSFVEWLFTRSLVKHRHARDPSLWCPTARVKVLEVQKIENRTFLKRYAQRREELLEERAGQSCEPLQDIKTLIGKSLQNRRSIEEVCHCPDSGVNLNEVLLFHGSPSAKINGILTSGFDPRYAGLGTGAMFGQGSYFAHNASKCFRYAGDDDVERKNGGLCQTVLVVRALLGNPHYQRLMCPERRMPPANSDSVVALTKAEGGCVDHREYVLYDKASILPLYLIEFEHLPDCRCQMCSPQD
ncbi:unnamed protein product [Durusdinium trenchii]|uniref:Poly [ADP-ribose] polymerase n=1 Tax=Durusdinium trenchii TaxID=1381693 RepID=A0ABP0KGA4_9DINO